MIWLSILILVTAIAHIFADSFHRREICVITKPLVMVEIGSLLLLQPGFWESSIRLPILGGLLFSVVGDVFLLWPEKRFVAGLLSFLVAHIFYAYGFWHESSTIFWLPVVLLVPVVVIFIWLLWGFLGALRLPVIIYTLIIAWMLVCASSWLYSTPTLASFYAALGATLFVISDACLAWQKFRGTYVLASLWIMATYYAAQLLIVLSTCL